MDAASETQTRRDELVHAWAFVLQVAGSATALGALVYGTGAATMWIRMKESGYPADVAVEHQSRSEMIALGVRGFALVIGVALAIGFAVLLLARLHAILTRPLPRLARWGEHLGTVRERAGAALGLVGLIASAFVSWRVFGIVFTLGAGAWILYPAAEKRRWPSPRRLLVAALTVVVARRAAEYKEPDLLVSMPHRLAALTGDPDRPVCLLVAGLAHPHDGGGKERIRRIVAYSADATVGSRVVYLPGYDMRIAQRLLAGADVWLNHPRRGDEACGTSFMKAVYCGGQVVTTADGGASVQQNFLGCDGSPGSDRQWLAVYDPPPGTPRRRCPATARRPRAGFRSGGTRHSMNRRAVP